MFQIINVSVCVCCVVCACVSVCLVGTSVVVLDTHSHA